MKTIAAAAASLAVTLSATGASALAPDLTPQQREAFKSATELSQREDRNHKAANEPKIPQPPVTPAQGDGK